MPLFIKLHSYASILRRIRGNLCEGLVQEYAIDVLEREKLSKSSTQEDLNPWPLNPSSPLISKYSPTNRVQRISFNLCSLRRSTLILYQDCNPQPSTSPREDHHQANAGHRSLLAFIAMYQKVRKLDILCMEDERAVSQRLANPLELFNLDSW